MRAKARKAIVSGATSGLGKALSHFLEEKGYKVLALTREECDLSRDRENLLSLITREVPDLIVNNAGFGLYGPALDQTQHQEMIEVNISALTEITLHAARTLREAKRPGTILNISSAGAFFPFPNFATYSATKAYVNSFSEALDAELKPHIRVLCACPGQIATSFRTKAARGYPQTLDRRTMSLDTACKYLWKQIEEQKSLYIFGWRTKLEVWLGKLLPRGLRNAILARSIESRLPK